MDQKYIIFFIFFSLINQVIFAQTLNVGVVQMTLDSDLDANKSTLIKFIKEANKRDCDLVVFPEMALSSEADKADSAYIKQLANAI